jgi:hypothetical protein
METMEQVVWDHAAHEWGLFVTRYAVRQGGIEENSSESVNPRTRPLSRPELHVGHHGRASTSAIAAGWPFER